MNFTLKYEEAVVKKDIPTLGKATKEKVKQDIFKKLTTAPEQFGKPLKNILKNYRSMRCGNYRVVFRIEKKGVLIFAIGHRSFIYKEAFKRLLQK